MAMGPPEQTEVAGTRDSADRDDAARAAAGIARGAMIIGSLTVISRILGLVRTLVFARSVGAGCLGTAYTTANQVPNLIYELVLGGALTGAMIPVLAGSAQRAAADPAAKARVAQITSALLTWTVVILVPLTFIIAGVAHPIAAALNPVNPNSECVHSQMVNATTTMLVIFTPQILLYGISVVLFGVLQAYRRFTGPALAPVIANVVLITCYLCYASLDQGLPLARTPALAELVLAAGTTLNIAALAVVPAFPAWRLRLRVRPTFQFPPGVAQRAGGLVLVGLIYFAAQDVSAVVVIAIANGHGDTGALVLFNYVSQVLLAAYAVLAVSIITSAYSVLSARNEDTFDQTCAGSTRAVSLTSWLGTALIAAVAGPAAHVLAKQPDQVTQLTEGFVLWAPGLAGLAVITNLSQVMYVLGKLKVAAMGLVGVTVLGIVLNIVLAELSPPDLVVGALAVGNAIANIVMVFPMVVATRRIRGQQAVAGIGRANLAGVAAAVAGSAVGVAASLALPVTHKLLAGGSAVLAACCATIAFVAVAYFLDKDDLRAAMAPLGRLGRLGRAGRLG
jgi:putative peptidoglycan lipid II flippase